MTRGGLAALAASNQQGANRNPVTIEIIVEFSDGSYCAVPYMVVQIT